MSMLDVAKYLSYSRSIDLTSEKGRYFNLSMANSGRLFSCLNSAAHSPTSSGPVREQGRRPEKGE